MRAVDIIIRKKQGYELTKDELHFLIDGYVKGIIPDYQISAFLMAVCFVPLTENEQYLLTMEMLQSGEQMDLSSIHGICVDKHSTGGVGDKTTLVVGPILASFGLKLAKMSGRGLGHTGGTLDKLESIPHFQIQLPVLDFYNQVNEISLAVIGQSLNIVPADKKLYALRDVTGTVESIGLIASSIMSKKLASGAHSILLDVKVGDGAFMKDVISAEELAMAMVKIGKKNHRQVIAVLTNMEEPLGKMVGNSLEVIEAIETLKGKGEKKFTELCYALSSELLIEEGICQSKEEAYSKIKEKIETKEALEKLRQMIQYQHGDTHVIEDYSLFPQAQYTFDIHSLKEGYVNSLHAQEIGHCAMLLGAGRKNKEDKINLAVGIKLHKKQGDFIHIGDTLCTIYSDFENIEEVQNKILQCYQIEEEKPKEIPMIYKVIK